jgi:hypothetical protein
VAHTDVLPTITFYHIVLLLVTDRLLYAKASYAYPFPILSPTLHPHTSCEARASPLDKVGDGVDAEDVKRVYV